MDGTAKPGWRAGAEPLAGGLSVYPQVGLPGPRSEGVFGPASCADSDRAPQTSCSSCSQVLGLFLHLRPEEACLSSFNGLAYPSWMGLDSEKLA